MEVVAAQLLSVGLPIILDALVKNLKKSARCRSECERLELDIERHRPQLVRLAKELDERKQNGQVLFVLDERFTELKALLLKADEIVHEFSSGTKVYNKLLSGKLATRIEEIRTLIEGKVKDITFFEVILATNPLHQGHCSLRQGHCPAATNLQHCHCAATNNLHCCHCLRQHGASMPHLHTVHSDPSRHHSAWDFPVTSHLLHSHSEEVLSSNVDHDNVAVLGIDQWRNEVGGFNEAERRTRADLHRRHSTTGIPHYPKSGAPGYPIARYSEPETSTHTPSAPPLPISTPRSPRGGPSGSKSSNLADGPLFRALQKGRKG